MPSIGAVSCDYLFGELSGLRERVLVQQVAGLNGYTAHKSGQGESAFAYLAVSYTTNVANAETFISDLEALQGTVVTITDDHGTSFENCLVVRVGRPSKSRAVIDTTNYRTEVPVRGVKLQ